MKSEFFNVKLAKPSVTTLLPSDCEEMVVPSVPYTAHQPCARGRKFAEAVVTSACRERFGVDVDIKIRPQRVAKTKLAGPGTAIDERKYVTLTIR